MIESVRRPVSWPVAAGLVAVAAAIGFGAAYWHFGRRQPVAAPVTSAASASADSAAEIRIPAEYLAIAQIGVEAIGSGGMMAEILTTGTVAAPPNSEAIVVARAPGNVTRVKRQLGDTVHAGETLALLDSLEAAAMAAERSAANAKLELARKSFSREEALFKQGITPRQEMEAAQAALAVAEAEAHRASSAAQAAHLAADGNAMAVVSPIDGTVSAQMVTLGAYVQPQTELFRVTAGGRVQVEASVPASDIGRIAVGDQASIVPASGTPVAATVRSVTPTVSGITRTATVVLTPAAAAHGLVVGEGVQARLHVKNGAGGMVVAEDAVQNIDGHDVLFVRTKDGFRAQPVLVGTRSRGMAQIVSGVRAGVMVATRNAFLVKADMIKSAKEE